LILTQTVSETRKVTLTTTKALFSKTAKKKIISLHDVTNKSNHSVVNHSVVNHSVVNLSVVNHSVVNHSVVNLAIYVQQSSSELEHVLRGDKSCRSVGAYKLRNILTPIFRVN